MEDISIYLLAISILLPIILGVICYLIPCSIARSIMVGINGVSLVAVSVYLTYIVMTSGTQYLEVHKLFGMVSLDKIIMFLDFALLLYIIYLGKKHSNKMIVILGIFQALPLAYFETTFDIKSPQNTFIIDNLSVIMVLVISIVGSAIAFYALGYMKQHEHHLHLPKSRQPRFFAIILLFLGAMNALVLTNDILWMYFFWEITTLCSFLLISHDKDETSIKNATRALLMNSIGGVAFVFGIIVTYYSVASLSIDEIIKLSPLYNVIMLIPLGLFCFAGFTKSAQFPFQSWLLGAMVAPTPVSALLHSSTMVKAGVYIIVRFSPAFAGTLLGKIVAIVGAFTFLAGSAVAISQRNSKRVLAYSTVANLGLIICAAALGNAIGLGIAVLLIIVHAISKALLFLCVGTVEQEIGSRDIEDMQGLMRKMPYTAVIMVLGMISMLLPPFGVFITKWLTIEASINNPIVLLCLVLGSAFTVVFWAKWIGIVLTMSTQKAFKKEILPFSVKSSLGFLITLTFAVSIMIIQIYNLVISKFVESNFGKISNSPLIQADSLGFHLVSGNVIFGGFPVFLFFGLFLMTLIKIPVSMASTKNSIQSKPYLCGENTDDIRGIEAYMPGDRIQPVVSGNYYLKAFFSEDKLTLWLNLVAVAIIMIMFGVIFNG